MIPNIPNFEKRLAMNIHKNFKAIGFDLFNTLITVEPTTMDRAHANLSQSLRESGFDLVAAEFNQKHHEAALTFLEESRNSGRETHNRFWISAALESQGYPVDPEDSRVAEAVDAYFSAFYKGCHLIPGTIKMLASLESTHRLGLLSNFTHGPAARKIIEHLGLAPFFKTILISGELGYRKPHPFVFERLVEELGTKRHLILYVGDDPESDIQGALRAGLQPAWISYVQDQKLNMPFRILSGGAGEPDRAVPRISTWEDLFVYLGAVAVD
jgi:putative hydrolase of the HAD superfamily